MEAKNTVMTWKQTVECSHNPTLELRIEAIKEAQAEISFKAGERQGIEKGRREVVEWIERKTVLRFTDREWQAKLKDWGINESNP